MFKFLLNRKETTNELSSDATTPNESEPSTAVTSPAPSDSDVESRLDGSDIITDAMREEEETMRQATEAESKKNIQAEAQNALYPSIKEQRMKRLNFLLDRSSIYAKILTEKLQKQREEAREAALKSEGIARKKENIATDKEQATLTMESDESQNDEDTTSGLAKRPKKNIAMSTKKVRTSTISASTNSKKRKAGDDNYLITDYVNEEELSKRIRTTPPPPLDIQAKIKPTASARQPSLVTGGILREYQLAGVEWLVSLWENGLNGILADEMGLGKTLQTISLIAHLKEKGVAGPFLIVTPLSTLANWVSEFKRFTPTIEVVLYHGTKEEREHIRNWKLKRKDDTKPSFPVVVTSYEIVMNDRKYLEKYEWKYVIVDEGHRLKNLNCKLIRELKSYRSANRLLLTGTPLQNNLAELWSLLNFLLPDIFDDLGLFQAWFDFSDIQEKEGQQRIMKQEDELKIVSSLHAILKPFLLRRLKNDVEYSLPKKKEYILYAPLSESQKELYDAIINKNLRSFLIDKKVAPKLIRSNTEELQENIEKMQVDTQDDKENEQNGDELVNLRRKSERGLERKDYREISDSKWLRKAENGDLKIEAEATEQIADVKKVGAEWERRNAERQIGSLKLQNMVMQLRKVCNHPYLFDWPLDPKTQQPIISPQMAKQSGKILLLDRLLPALISRGHKVLIFSQFTTMLDILEDWIVDLKKWLCFRIDGSVKQEDRRDMIQEFNKGGNVDIFLLSTRAGGLGINLTAADTVIIFDSDWNPQMDLQAQDRVHRIGQTKPVLVYRLVTGNTVEQKIIERATAKRKLEKLVIQKGKFKLTEEFKKGKDKPDASNLRELAEILASDDGEKITIARDGGEVISDKDLEMLLDRSPMVFEDKIAENKRMEKEGVFREIMSEELRDETNDALADM